MEKENIYFVHAASGSGHIVCASMVFHRNALEPTKSTQCEGKRTNERANEKKSKKKKATQLEMFLINMATATDNHHICMALCQAKPARIRVFVSASPCVCVYTLCK